MNKQQIGLVIFTCIFFCFLSCYFTNTIMQHNAYEAAYADGSDTGYADGYATGEDKGYSSGKDKGYSAGYTEGESSGNDAGYKDGYNQGMDDGYTAGKNESIAYYAQSEVYTTLYGGCYHTKDCSYLNNSSLIIRTTRAAAEADGYYPCSRCQK